MADKTVRIIVRGVDEVSGTFDKIGKKIGGRGGLAGALGTVGKVAAGVVVGGVVAAGAGVAAFGASAIKGAISYESAFAGVTKTTDGLVDSAGKLTAQGEEMRKAFLDLSTVKPISPETLAGIGELGGQLGIQKENLIDFTGVIADLAVTTNLTEEAAATSFARIANVMGTPQDQFDRMGSSVVELGNNFATTEAEIVSFANRIAGAGAIVGMSEADVLGISAAFSSVGVQAEAGGTAVQKALLTMNEAVMTGGDNLEIFALTAGLSAEEFKELWERDAASAFSKFVQGLGIAGDDAAGILDMLGLSDQRLLTAFLKLGNAGDLVTKAIDASNIAWEENNALSKEAQQRYNTTESQIQLLKNTFGKLSKEIGLAFLPALTDIVKTIREFVSKHSDAMVQFFTRIGSLAALAIPKLLDLATTIFNIGRFLFETLVSGDALNDWLTHLPEPLRPILNNFGEFIALLRDSIPAAIKFASDFWTRVLQPALAQTMDFINNAVMPVFWTLVNLIQDNVVPVIGFIANTILRVSEAFVQVRGKILDFIMGLSSGLQQSNPLLDAFKAAWGLISGAVQAAMSVIGPAIQTFLENFRKGFSRFEILIPRFAKLWEAIRPIVIGAVLLIGAAIAGLLGLITGVVSGIANAIEPFLIAFANIVDGVTQIITGFINFITGVGELIVGILTLDADVIKDAWRRIVGGLGDIWQGLWTTLKGMTIDSLQATLAFVDGFVSGVIDFFNLLFDALVGGSIVPDLVNQILFLFGTLKDGALGILGELVTGAISLGNDLVSGLAGAIKSGVGTVTGAIGGLLNNAINTAKKTLKSGSPSRVFMSLGEDIGTGLTAGMRSMMSAVQSEAQGLTSFGGLASAAPATGAMGGGGITNIQIFVEGVNVSRGSTGAANAEDEALIMMIEKIRRALQLS